MGLLKSVTRSKILRILKAHGLAPEIPEYLYHLIKKAVEIGKHLERNMKDKDSKFRLILVESGIYRLARYYKKTETSTRLEIVGVRGRKPQQTRVNSVPATSLDSSSGIPLPDKRVLELILEKLQKKDIYGVYTDPVDPEEVSFLNISLKGIIGYGVFVIWLLVL